MFLIDVEIVKSEKTELIYMIHFLGVRKQRHIYLLSSYFSNTSLGENSKVHKIDLFF